MLFGSTALDVAIGLVFVYLVVSLVCSAFSEGLESIFKHRSKDLERGIREMLTDTAPPKPGAAAPQDYVQIFYDHPLISSLFKGDYATARRKWELPAYIPARSFALAIMDLMGATGARPHESAGTLDATGGAAGSNQPLAVNPLTPLRTAAVNFSPENPKLSKALVALIDAAGADANQARLNIENWFNSSMDRVSGWYKHRAQIIIFGFGFCFAAVANVDSLAIIRILSTDGGVREALVAQAKNAPAPQSGPQPITKDPVESLRHLGLPLGWEGDGVPARNDYYGLLMKALGIFLTGLAVSMGAPFWFDVLNTIIVVRSTVKPAEKSPPEKPK